MNFKQHFHIFYIWFRATPTGAAPLAPPPPQTPKPSKFEAGYAIWKG